MKVHHDMYLEDIEYTANINLPWYYDYISYFYEQYPVCTKRFLIDKYGEQLDVNTRNEIIDNYNIIQYDLLYKKKVINRYRNIL